MPVLYNQVDDLEFIKARAIANSEHYVWVDDSNPEYFSRCKKLPKVIIAALTEQSFLKSVVEQAYKDQPVDVYFKKVQHVKNQAVV